MSKEKNEVEAKKEETKVSTPTKAEKKEAKKEKVKEVKEVKAKREPVSAPPVPPAKIGEVVNPIVAEKNLKRAVAVAIAMQVTSADGKTFDQNRAAEAIRASGLLHKQGTETPTPLVQNEWSGKPYAKWASKEAKIYAAKHPEKIEKVLPFVKELMKTVQESKKPEGQMAEAGIAL